MARRTEYPPHPLGRLVAAQRHNALRDPIDPKLPHHVRNYLADVKGKLTRIDVANIAACIAESGATKIRRVTISKEDVESVELKKYEGDDETLYWILRGSLISHEDAAELLNNQSLRVGSENVAGINSHLITGDVRQRYAAAEFGPLACAALSIRKSWTTWVDVVSAGPGGFGRDELQLQILRAPKVLDPEDAQFNSLAVDIKRDWKRRKSETSDNPTVAIKSISVTTKPDLDERPILDVKFVRSFYRFNCAAKGPGGLRFRWEQLISQDDPKNVLTHLTSGVGVVVNVVCARDDSIVIGQRQNVSFRRDEFDVAVVEGIRPTANVNRLGRIDLFAVVRRALDEELGLKYSQVAIGRDSESLIKDLRVVGFGVDLRYYQYNFLCNVVLDAEFSDVAAMWTHAVDRRENKKLYHWPADLEEVIQRIRVSDIWSAGMACLMRTSDYWHAADE
ncbi:hypothetical protein HL666_04120 [Bradyrhizobium sp. 83002]|uniref:hypothetical protein n=1 Tax=Bradyrhizobium aeschynomenes TaxID=2734909 RepID=UPI00155735BB|nr:hypothetical protein [Bradyrhizobium aeschynomenes]NPU09939.1 hypothetical protein [Bradyrhizobium aeschynomenes]